MAKLPAIQFYPGDWLQDSIAGCSLAAQGLWLRMMFIAHNSDKYGYLAVNGAALSPEAIARRCGCTLEQYTTLLAELDDAFIPSRTSSGMIYSRRMVRDAKCRADNKFRQQDYRNSHKTNENSNGLVTPLSQRSSSSSSSSELKTKTTPPQAALDLLDDATANAGNSLVQPKPKPKSADVFVLPDWIPVEPWEAFVKMRTRVRAPLSERAKRGIVRDLDRLRTIGNDIAEVLDRSEKNCWKGVFALPGAEPDRRKEERFVPGPDRYKKPGGPA